jgi:hypothetical protein
MSINLQLEPESLRPLIEGVVSEVLRQLQAEQEKLNSRLAYNEQEAAELLGLKPYQLRDLRLAGKIAAVKPTKKAALYRREDLIAFLARGQVEMNGKRRR